MDLKVTEGIIRITQLRFMKKNSNNIDFDFQPKIENFIRLQYGEKKGRNGDGERR